MTQLLDPTLENSLRMAPDSELTAMKDVRYVEMEARRDTKSLVLLLESLLVERRNLVDRMDFLSVPL